MIDEKHWNAHAICRDKNMTYQKSLIGRYPPMKGTRAHAGLSLLHWWFFLSLFRICRFHSYTLNYDQKKSSSSWILIIMMNNLAIDDHSEFSNSAAICCYRLRDNNGGNNSHWLRCACACVQSLLACFCVARACLRVVWHPPWLKRAVHQNPSKIFFLPVSCFIDWSWIERDLSLSVHI